MAYGTTYDPENSTGRLLALKKKFHRKPSDVLSMDVPEEVGNVGANIPGRLAWQYHFEKLQNIRESRVVPNTERFLGRDQSVIAEEIQRRREALIPRLAQLGYSTNLSTIDQIEQAEKNVRRVNVMKNLEASRASRKASKFVAPEKIIEEKSDKEESKTTKKEESISANDRRERRNTKIGMESALFGSRGMKFFRQMFGYGFGYGHIIRSVARFAIGNSLMSSERALQTSLASLTTGASFKDLYGAGGIAKLFGGSETDAASMYASINAFRSGVLMDRGMGQLGKLLDYRTAITPFMSEKEILDSIARRYHEIGVEQGAGIQALYAAETGFSAPIIKAMSEHWENFSDWVENEMPKISNAQQEMLDEQARAARELTVAWDNLKDVVAIELIPVIKWLSSVIKNQTGGIRFAQELENIRKKHSDWSVAEQAKYLDKQGLGEFIPKTIWTKPKRTFGAMGMMPMKEVENPLYAEWMKLHKIERSSEETTSPTVSKSKLFNPIDFKSIQESTMETPMPYWGDYKKLQEAPSAITVPSIENTTSGVFKIDINSSQDMYGLAVALGNTARSYLGEEGIGINIRSVA